MTHPIEHPGEPAANAVRADALRYEPRSLRTFTPSQAVLSRSAGCYHWTPDGRRLYDFTSGVLVANLGHNPARWLDLFASYMGWPAGATPPPAGVPAGYVAAAPMTAYNAVTPLEAEASRRLVEVMRRSAGGGRMEQVVWAASGSEAVQKALWAALARDPARPLILATRRGFHGKKGLAAAVTGSEHDPDRDPRVKFIAFPMAECDDVSRRGDVFDPAPYARELDALKREHGKAIGTLITEPYLGGGGSYHPPAAYLQLLERFCRENDVLFILDEVQANFGRTNRLFAYESYGVEPDVVILGKGLGNGVPVAAAVGRADAFAALDYGYTSDTWSGNPLNCASVLATLDEFEAGDVLAAARRSSAVVEAGLMRMKELPFIAHVRGEAGGMVWGVEAKEYAGRAAAAWANALVLAGYRGDGRGTDGVHLLGPLSGTVVRVAPPLTITPDEAAAGVGLLARAAARLLD